VVDDGPDGGEGGEDDVDLEGERRGRGEIREAEEVWGKGERESVVCALKRKVKWKEGRKEGRKGGRRDGGNARRASGRVAL
jgi:hypothetical protein